MLKMIFTVDVMNLINIDKNAVLPSFSAILYGMEGVASTIGSP